MTRACELECGHCRVEPQHERSANELSTREGQRLLARLAQVEVPLVVLTGGDPARRPDLVRLVMHGASMGLRLSLAPPSTYLVSRQLLSELTTAGLKRLSVSLDSPDAATHDAMRAVSGNFEKALTILRDARELGLETQINTLACRGFEDDLDAMAQLVERLGATQWMLFFPVPLGRMRLELLPTAEEVERSLYRLADLADQSPFSVRVSGAPHYRRVVIQRQATPTPVPVGLGNEKEGEGVRVNDGRGMLFVSHTGDVYPSGFLHVGCGNVRGQDLIEIYRYHPVFRSLRDPSFLSGKCGACDYRSVCGGSRARAYSLTRSLVASDPLCAYIPPHPWHDDGAIAAARALHRLPIMS